MLISKGYPLFVPLNIDKMIAASDGKALATAILWKRVVVDWLMAIFFVRFRSKTEPNSMNEVGLIGTGVSFETKSKLHIGMLLKRVCRNPVVSDVYTASEPNTLV